VRGGGREGGRERGARTESGDGVRTEARRKRTRDERAARDKARACGARDVPIVLLAHHLDVHTFLHLELLARVVVDGAEVVEHLGAAERLLLLAFLIAVFVFAVVPNLLTSGDSVKDIRGSESNCEHNSRKM
jgi:hypothetical protein